MIALVVVAVLDLAPGAVVVDELGDTLAVMPADPDTTTGGDWSTDCWTWYDRDGDGVDDWVYGAYCSTWVPFSRGSDPLYFRLDPPPPTTDSLEVSIPHPGATVRVSITDVSPYLWTWNWWPVEPVELWGRTFMFAPPSVKIPAGMGQAVVVRGWSVDGLYFATVERLP